MGKKRRRPLEDGYRLSPGDLRFVIPPSIYRSVEVLCRDALAYGANSAGIRQAVSQLINVGRREALARFGHDTPDIIGLSALLARSDPFRQAMSRDPSRKPEQEPVVELARQAHIDSDQLAAADLVKRVNTAWGRFLAVGARSYESRSQKHKDRALDPFWVMGENVYKEWRNVYNPWYDEASKKKVGANNRGMVTAARVVIHVVMLPMFPGQMDTNERLDKGTSLRVLKEELALLAGMR